MLKWLICLFALIYGKYIDSAKEQDGDRFKDTTEKLIWDFGMKDLEEA